MSFCIIAEKISHAGADLEHEFLFSEKRFPLPFHGLHFRFVRKNMRMFCDFLDVDILVGHVQIVLTREINQENSMELFFDK